MRKFYLSIIAVWFLLIPSAKFCDAAFPTGIINLLTQISSPVVDDSIRNVEPSYPHIALPENSVNLPLAGAAKSAIQIYFPLNDNDMKSYQGEILGKNYHAPYYYHQVFFNGRSCYSEEDGYDGSMAYYGYSGDELQLYGIALNNENYPLNTPLTILNNSLLTTGGTLNSTSTITAEGYDITINLTVTSKAVGSKIISLGTVDNCYSIEMGFSLIVSGEIELGKMKDVWILAPGIGKLEIAVMDQILNPLGWLTLVDGTVGGVPVTESITAPIVETKPVIASLVLTPDSGTAPLPVTATCNANDPDGGSIVEYRWDFNNDGVVETTTNTGEASYNFADPGNYEISCTVVDDEGQTSEALVSLVVDEEINYVQGDYNYYLPYFKAGNGIWTGLALTNRNQKDSSQLQVTVYGSDGKSLAAEYKTIPAHGQDSFVVAAQLNDSGWIQVNSHQPMSGLAFLGNWGEPVLMADIPFSSKLSSCLVVPHIAQNDMWDTTVLICNPNNEPASLTIKYVDKAGVEQGSHDYTIPKFGSGEYLLSIVFSNKIPLAGSVEINSSNGIAAFALYSDRKIGGTYYAGINAESCE